MIFARGLHLKTTKITNRREIAHVSKQSTQETVLELSHRFPRDDGQTMREVQTTPRRKNKTKRNHRSYTRVVQKPPRVDRSLFGERRRLATAFGANSSISHCILDSQQMAPVSLRNGVV